MPVYWHRGRIFMWFPFLADTNKIFSITGENPPQCGSDIFKNVDLSKATLYVPADKVTYYQTTEPWSKFGTVKTLSGETPSTPVA